MRIRHADPATDSAACATIYAPSVTDGVASFEERPPDAEEMAARIAATSARWPWLVSELDDGTVAGYAYATAHRARPAYRWVAEVSVYVDGEHHRRGVGRALYGELLALVTAQGFYEACAGITLPNPASVALHESLGFEPVGVYRRIGFKFGRWWDVGWWQLSLRDRVPGETPAEPGPPAVLPGG